MQLHYIILFCTTGILYHRFGSSQNNSIVIRNSLMGARQYIFSMLCHGIYYYVGIVYSTCVKGAILYQSTAAAIFSKIGRQKSQVCKNMQQGNIFRKVHVAIGGPEFRIRGAKKLQFKLQRNFFCDKFSYFSQSKSKTITKILSTNNSTIFKNAKI